jgi:hypothetical protein
MFFFNSNIPSTMFVSVSSHTVYHSKLLYFCFVLEFNIWHRIGWVHHRFFCCSIFSFLCSALKIIVCFYSVGHWIVCIRFVLPWSISPLTSSNCWTLHCLSCDLRLCFLLIISWLLLRYFLISPFVPSDLWPPICCLLIPPFGFFLITPLVSLDHSVVIFRSLRWYLQITPLVSSDYPFVIFWLCLWYLLITPLVSSDYAFCICWLPTWYLLIPSSVLITPFVSSNYHLWYLLINTLLSSDVLCCGHCDCRSFVICLPSHKLELPRYDNLRNIIIFDGVHRFIQQIHKI